MTILITKEEEQKRLKIIKTAREWLGTPWQHHVKLKGVGVDCVHFLIAVADECEIKYQKPENYYHLNDGDSMIKELLKNLKPTEKNKLGNIACFRFSGIPHHVGILTEIGLIHASFVHKKVVEHILDEFWQKRLVAIFSPY